jgi:hypothetical protein
MRGLGILDPETGTREAVIRFSKGEEPDPVAEDTHPPAIDGGVLYAINQNGRVFALRHP